MTTKRQKEANKRNAKKSTGPRTPEGKENSRRNALKHGFTANRTVTLDFEDENEYQAHKQALIDYYNPVGPAEAFYVDRIAALQWVLQRVRSFETGILNDEYRSVGGIKLIPASTWMPHPIEGYEWENEEQGYLYCQAAEDDEPPPADDPVDLIDCGDAYRRCANLLANLMRYETSLERQLSRAIEALEKLQDKRKQVEAIVINDCEVV